MSKPVPCLSTSIITCRLPSDAKRKIEALAMYDNISLNRFVGLTLAEVIQHRAELRNAPVVYFDHGASACDD